ncbi:hypothetical protein [Sorangium sp. So ce233]|uniref:hypothetical protein n=1 Tax=Sorangium sp. So ce233 TaxID=3133290 RepID=UPI003F5F1B5C
MLRREAAWWLIAVTAAGCAGAPYRTEPETPRPGPLHFASAGPTGCDPGEITIGGIQGTGRVGTWISTCRGMTFRCSAMVATERSRHVLLPEDRLDDVSCSPVAGAAAQPGAAGARAGAPPAAGVAREPRDDGRGSVLRARFAEDPFAMTVSVFLDASSDEAVWSLVPAGPAASGVDEACAVVLLVDGDKVPLLRSASAGDPRAVQVKTPLSLVARLAAAERVVGACVRRSGGCPRRRATS